MNESNDCCVSYSEDCKLLAYSSPDGRLKIWDTDSGTLKQEYVPSSHLSAAATCISWQGKQQEAAPRHRKQRRRSAVTSGGEGSDGTLLALGTPAGSVLVYSVLAGDLSSELRGQHTAAVRCLAWDASGQSVFSGAEDSQVVQWSVPSGKVKCKLKVGGRGGVRSVCPLPDGETVLTASRSITWWQLATGAALRTYTGHATEVTCLHHVPLPGLDGQGGYFVSAAAAGRVISAWQLTQDSELQSASVSFALPSEPCHVRVTAAGDGAALLTAATQDGQLHVFERHLNGVRRKPVKPKVSVRVASEGAAPRPLPVLCAQPGPERPVHLHFCHGSLLRPTFERLPYSPEEASVVLVRADPAAAAVSASDAVSRVKTPATDGAAVRQLSAGQLSTGRKRTAAAADAVPAQLPMQERLGALVAPPHGTVSKLPSTSNMAQLLVQGLAGRDRSMLKTVLQTEDADVISSTVAALPLDSVLPFISQLAYLLRFAEQSFSGLKWLRAVIERHSSFLLTQTDLDSLLAPIYSSVQVRLRSYPRLLQLRGRLEVIAGQMRARQQQVAARAGGDADSQPLLTYQDDSSDEDGDLLGLPAASPGGISDMSEDDQDLDSVTENDDRTRMEEDGSDMEGASDEDEDDADDTDSDHDGEEDDHDEDELMNGD